MLKIDFFKVSQSLIRCIPMSLVSHSFVTAIGWGNPIVLTLLTTFDIIHFVADLLCSNAQ